MDSLGYQFNIGQKVLRFLYQLALEPSAYNVTETLTFRFPVDAEILASSVERTISGHIMLDCAPRPRSTIWCASRRTTGVIPGRICVGLLAK
jgi:hypothetical protein